MALWSGRDARIGWGVSALLLVAPTAYADISFSKHIIPTTSGVQSPGGRSISSADLDGDGDIDLFLATSGIDQIAWFENDGDGGFTEHVISTNADGAKSIAGADVDGDGDIDLLSASEHDDKIAWYENNGSGDFTEHLVSSTPIRSKR